MRHPSAAAERFVDRLGLALPIVQAPMAGVQTAALAAAAGAAGALGSLPGAALAPDALREAVSTLRAERDRAFVCNFFCHAAPVPDPAREAAWRRALAPYYAEFGIDPATVPAGPGRLPFDAAALEAVEALRPAVVGFHFGLPPAPALARVRATGAQVWASATTVDEARWLEAHGADAVIAQGLEAGGHRGSFLAEGDGDDGRPAACGSLVPRVLAAVSLPVIAAGGIVDADAVLAALRHGAAAVQCGTAFLETPEATTSAVHRDALRARAAAPAGGDTVLTNLFSGRAARGLVNRLIRELGPISDLPPAFPGAVAALAPLRAAAERAGRDDFSPLWAGARRSAFGARPAAAVVQALAERL